MVFEKSKVYSKNAGFSDEEREKMTRTFLTAGFYGYLSRYFYPDAEGISTSWYRLENGREKRRMADDFYIT